MDPATDMTIARQVFWLLVLALPIACVARTVVYEEVFREPREYCQRKSQTCRTLFQRKFFYLFTCEYCFSHYVTIAFIALTGFRLLIDDWRGYILAFFALVLVANAYLNLYARLKLDITSERKEIEKTEKVIEATENEIERQAQELAHPLHPPAPQVQAGDAARADRQATAFRPFSDPTQSGPDRATS
jgi:hypothetical protein